MNQALQHIWEQQLMLLQTSLDSKQFNAKPERYNQLVNIYSDGFIYGSKSPLRTEAYKNSGPTASADSIRYTTVSQERMDYLNNELPQKLEAKGFSMWEKFVRSDQNVDYLSGLLADHYGTVQAADLVDLYFEGLDEGVFFGLIEVQLQHTTALTQTDYQQMILNERDRYVDAFFNNFKTNKDFMNQVFQHILKRVQQP